MRIIQVTIPEGKRQTVIDLLDERDLDYVVSDETSSREYDSIVYFPAPTTAVEEILDILQEEGIDQDSHTLVMDAETVVSDRFDTLQEQYATQSVEEEQISRQELITRADELTPTFTVFLTMTMISTVVATAGLLLDSPAVVVGSMVIAPLIGPALASSIGTVVNDRELVFTGARYQFVGVAAGIIAAAVFAWILQSLFIVPPGTEITAIDEVAERIAPELLLLPVALGAGAAGILSLATGFSVAIVGVMIAAALIPPMAAAGIAIAWGLPFAALGSVILVLVNLLGVNLAGLLTLWYIGYRPGSWIQIPQVERQMAKQIAIYVGAILLLSLFLVSITFVSYQVSVFEQTATEEVESELDEHDELQLLELNVEIEQAGLPIDRTIDGTHQVETVVVEVGGPPGTYDADLVERLHERINQHTANDVTVQVRFVTSGQR